ncbi:MAG TPA: hypothetical protein VI338_06850 [Nitrososphaera sp.]|nr:hypothetical protein [Nitrososphaera sp.]
MDKTTSKDAGPLTRKEVVAMMRNMHEIIKRMNGQNGHENGEELSEDQKKIKEKAQAFEDAVKGPSEQSLRECEQRPAELDEHGNVILVPAKPVKAAEPDVAVKP